MSYILANPHVEGKALQSNQKSVGGAAEEIWSKLSGNIKQYIPVFFFTIQDTNKNKFYHYKVKESLEGGKVKYTLSQFNQKVDEKTLKQGISNQDGGRRKKHDSSSSSDSSDSSSDDYVYYPKSKSKRRDNSLSVTYYPTIYGIPNILIPTFSTSFAPYVNIGLNPGLPTVFTWD